MEKVSLYRFCCHGVSHWDIDNGSYCSGYQKRSELGKPQPVDGYEENDHAVHFHGSASNSPELIRHRIISQVLELGILVHSVIIGISLGACQSQHTIKPLVAALSFHQFF
ncbi:hypothetical protein ACFX13_036868 [Malus domestica]